MVKSSKKYPKQTAHDWVLNIDLPLNQLPSIEWLRLKSQYHLYRDHPGYPKYNAWFDQSNRLKRRLRKIGDGLLALNELDQSNLDDKQKDIVKDRLLSIIKLNLIKLDIIQSKKLLLDDPLRFAEKRAQQKLDYRKQLDELENILNKEKHSRQFDKVESRYLQTTFKKHEIRTIHFKKYTDPTQKAGVVVGIISTGYSFVKRVEQAFPALFAISQAVKNGLMAIPIVDSVLTAIPLIVDVIKTWVKRQSTTKKSIALGVALLAIAAIVFSGVFPVAAAGIGIGMLAIGLIRGHFYPLGQTQKKILEKQIESNLMEARIHDFLGKTKKTFSLESQEKFFLTRQLDVYLTSQVGQPGYPSIAEMNKTKALIIDGDYQKLRKDPLMNKINQNKELKEVLLNNAIERRIAINDEVVALKKQRSQQIKLMIAGIATLIGVILVCIPTPPTLILGASLLVASSVAAPVIKYNVVSKVKNFFVELFTGKDLKGNQSEQALRSRVERNHESTADIMKRVPANDPVIVKSAEIKQSKSGVELKSRKDRVLFSEPKQVANDKEIDDQIVPKIGKPNP